MLPGNLMSIRPLNHLTPTMCLSMTTKQPPTGAPVFACDEFVPADVVRLFDDVQARLGTQTW